MNAISVFGQGSSPAVCGENTNKFYMVKKDRGRALKILQCVIELLNGSMD